MASVGATGGEDRRQESVRLSGAPAIDAATLIGVLGAFVVIGMAMAFGGSAGSFVDIPAVLIVVGGTFLVTTVSFTLEEVLGTQSIVLRAVVYHSDVPNVAARRMLYLADHARQHGALALEGVARNMRPGRFLAQAVQLVADGLPSEEIELILTRERLATHERHVRSGSILRRAGEVAPAMGLIGTLVGLIQMLGHLDDPSSIGPSMAVALLTTFYGAVLANMVFHPLASKLERNSDIEATVNQIYTMGAVSISRQENPRRLEIMVNTLLSPGHRVSYFD